MIPNIPYHVEGWSKSQNLKKIPGIEKRVRDKFAVIHKALDEKDARQFIKQLTKSIKESKSFYYLTDKEQENSINELEDLLSKPNIISASLDDGSNVFSKMKVMYSREKLLLADIFRKHGLMRG